jgi:hypothetical protein
MTATTRRRSQLATVWILHQAGREAAGHVDADRAWAEKEALRDSRGCSTVEWFNPVEINIGLDDVKAAVAKWERIAGLKGVCHVDIHDRRPGQTRNEFYA